MGVSCLYVVSKTENVILLSLLTTQGKASMAEITIRISDKVLKAALVVLGAIFLVWGFSHLWSSGAFRPKYQIQMFVPQAEGVRVGAPVRLDGMLIGSVSSLELAHNSTDSTRGIEVLLRIEKRFQNMIRDDSTASLITGGLLGDRYINVQRGFTGSPINSGGEIRVVPVKEVTFTDFVGAIKKIADCQNEEKNSANNKSPISTKKSQKPQ
jgi:phospholipid/cholesterol/gamma-HCH transport system substrate-binding protein